METFTEHQSVINFREPTVEHKGWGSEVVIINCHDYCAKILCFKAGAKGSVHFHCSKHETWRILSGKIRLNWVDTTNAEKQSKILSVGDIVDIPRFCPHQVEALTDSEIMEVSTTHYDDDSYRVEPGDSQNKKI
jgi:mannose-6-phosphate isomerase-like protein (cupin superfamily)